MVPFSADQNRQLRSVYLFGSAESCEGLDDFWQLLINDHIELSLRNTITVDDDFARQSPLVLLIEFQPFLHHGLEICYHLVDY